MLHSVAEQTAAVTQAPKGMQREATANTFAVCTVSSYNSLCIVSLVHRQAHSSSKTSSNLLDPLTSPLQTFSAQKNDSGIKEVKLYRSKLHDNRAYETGHSARSQGVISADNLERTPYASGDSSLAVTKFKPKLISRTVI